MANTDDQQFVILGRVWRTSSERIGKYSSFWLGLGGPGHGPVFGTPLGPHLNSVSVSISVHLGHGSVRFGLNFGLS